jgi:hypothetical protein
VAASDALDNALLNDIDRAGVGRSAKWQPGIWIDAAGARENQSLSVEAQERIARDQASHAERK